MTLGISVNEDTREIYGGHDRTIDFTASNS
jgi:hypothetical protein